jgi:hypothetical protein
MLRRGTGPRQEEGKDLVTFIYIIRFVDGPLAGLTSTQRVSYPESSRNRVIAEFQNDIEFGRVIKGIGGADYQIETYGVED